MSVVPPANHQNPSWTRPVGQSSHCQNQDRNICPTNCKVVPANPIRGYPVKKTMHSLATLANCEKRVLRTLRIKWTRRNISSNFIRINSKGHFPVTLSGLRTFKLYVDCIEAGGIDTLELAYLLAYTLHICPCAVLFTFSSSSWF